VEPFEAVQVRKDGSRIEVSVAISPIHDAGGRVVGGSAIARDVTERKRGGPDPQRVTPLIGYSPGFIGLTDPDQAVLVVHGAGQRLVGLDGPDQVHRTSIPDYFSEAERERIGREILPALLERGHWHGEVSFRHFQTGASVPVRCTAFTLPGPDGGRPGYLACV